MIIQRKWFLFVVYQTLVWYGNCEKYQVITADEPVYEPNWDSLDSRPLPNWYDAAKIGIFLHWGVYSVPTFGSEWFWYYLRGQRQQSYIDYMTKNFKPGFTYQDFAPQFTAEHFDANEWATLFEQSGAKYVLCLNISDRYERNQLRCWFSFYLVVVVVFGVVVLFV